MIQRRLTLPVAPDRLWTALTDPDAWSRWMGGRVEWELVPGGQARFDDHGTPRRGRIEDVDRGRRLRFRWWPDGLDGPDGGGEAGVSEVTYDLRPDGDGTELTVTERAVPQAASACIAAPAGSAPALRSGAGPDAAWTAWDGRLLRVWAHSVAAVPARI